MSRTLRLSWVQHPIALSAACFYLLAGLFYFLQNNFIQVGGQVAFVKVLWLMTAIYLWFIFPVFIFKSYITPTRIKFWFKLFWLLMVGRAVIELFLMYVTRSWHPYMGIAHDFLCLAVLGNAYFKARKKERAYKSTYLFIMFTLAIEAFFAYYMLHNVKSSSPVYYVPSESQHQLVFNITWFAVGLSIVFLILFTKRWILMHLDKMRID